MIVSEMLAQIALWQERARGRRLLLEMDARMLKDIALTESEIASEASKPWWRF